jgi:oligopeptide transport system substrate-binding protein
MQETSHSTKLPEGTVTFLFTDIEGSTKLLNRLGDVYGALLSEHRRILREIVAIHHGQEVDTQGDSFFVSFPRATQAVSAAVEIQRAMHDHKWLDSVEVRLRMGLHTGEPLTWAEGYAGIDVHRAARIAAVGHGGQVLLSQTTTPLILENLPEGVTLVDLGRHRLKDLRMPEHIGQLVIKGFSSEFPPLKSLEALPVDVPLELVTTRPPIFLQEGAESPSRPAFVARQRELAWLDERLTLALAGEGQIAFVTGGPGRGKSALFEVFMRQSMAADPTLLAMRGESSAHTGVGDPYQPFRNALGMLLGDLEGAWASGIIDREAALQLWEGMPQAAQLLLEVGLDLVDVFISGRALLSRLQGAIDGSSAWMERLAKHVEADRPISGELAQRNLFEQFEGLLIELSEKHPIVLVLDDLQWADSASINLLFHLGRRLKGRRILILGAYRPEEVALGRGIESHPLEKLLTEFKRLHGEIILTLGLEGEVESRTFIDAFIDTEPNTLDEDFRKGLADHTEGHPLFTVELLRAMQERGDLMQDERGRWVEGDALDWNTVPPRVEGVIEERIGRLKDELKEILTIASVEGDIFTAQVVARVQEVAERKLLKRLSRELEMQHRLVIESGNLEIGKRLLFQFQFTHTLFHQYLYNNLGEGERVTLHRDVAEVLEELYEGNETSIAVILAHQFTEASEMERAIPYLQIAGDRARMLYAHEEAISHYRRAFEFLKEKGDYEQAARTLMKIGLTYHTAFRFRLARQAYENGFSLWQRAIKLKSATPSYSAPHALRIASDEPITLDPTLAGDVGSTIVIDQLFTGLVGLSQEMDIVPEIAQSWDLQDGGRRYVFHLRDDFQWSNGSPVTAEDFEFAWKLILDPANGSRIASLLYDIKGAKEFHIGDGTSEDVGIQALDHVTLAVEMDKPTSYFLYLLPYNACYPVPRDHVETHGESWTQVGNIVTNGPFLLKSWQKSNSLTLLRNPAYHGSRVGNVEQVELSFITRSKQLEMYKSNRLDILFLGTLADQTRHLYIGEYISGPMPSTVFASFDVSQLPFNNPQIRQAFVLAIDREILTELALKGNFFPATGGFVPYGMPGHSEQIGLPYDPNRARRLLAEAGYPEGFDFPIQIRITLDGVESLVQQLCGLWEKNLGIACTWEVDKTTLSFDQMGTEKPHIVLYGWMVDYPDPDNFLRVSRSRNFSNWRNDSYDELVGEARSVEDQTTRMELYKQADKILVEEAPIIPIAYGRLHMLIKPWISRFSTSVTKWWFWKDIIIGPH